ncbi:hypothetical protein OF83DRAFT_1089021, partial [Amylostereum chailletii]
MDASSSDQLGLDGLHPTSASASLPAQTRLRVGRDISVKSPNAIPLTPAAGVETGFKNSEFPHRGKCGSESLDEAMPRRAVRVDGMLQPNSNKHNTQSRATRSSRLTMAKFNVHTRRNSSSDLSLSLSFTTCGIKQRYPLDCTYQRNLLWLTKDVQNSPNSYWEIISPSKIHDEGPDRHTASFIRVKLSTGDIEVTHELLRIGWAAMVPCTPSLPPEEKELREKYQAEAKDKKLGIWKRHKHSHVVSPLGPPPPELQGRIYATVVAVLDSTTLRVRFKEHEMNHVIHIRLVGVTPPVAAFEPSTPPSAYFADQKQYVTATVTASLAEPFRALSRGPTSWNNYAPLRIEPSFFGA